MHEQAMVLVQELRKSMSKLHRRNHQQFNRPMIHLLHIINCHGPQNMNLLSEHLGLTKPRITVIVNQLLDEGYLTVMIDEQDKRKKNIDLTLKGKEFIAQQHQKIKYFFSNIFEQFSSEEQQQWLYLLEKTIHIINGYEEKGENNDII